MCFRRRKWNAGNYTKQCGRADYAKRGSLYEEWRAKRAPAVVPQIEVTFAIDANGILMVSAKDLDTGKQQSITITANERMSEEEIAQAMRDAQEYAGVDETRREAMEVQQEAAKLLAEVEQKMKEAGKNLEKPEKKQLKNDCAVLQKLLSKLRLDKVTEQQVADIRQAKEQLEQSSASLRSR